MKNKHSNVGSFLFFLALWTISLPNYAQISAGGTPISLGSNFKSLAVEVQTLATLTLPEVDLQKIIKQDAENDLGNRFAVPIDVNFNLNNSGKWIKLSNGDFLWRLKLHSPGAHSLHLLFDRFRLPEGARLFIYDPSYRSILGAFTSANHSKSGRLGTDLIESSTIIIEYYEPAQVKGKGQLSISRINHGYKSIEFSKHKGPRKSSAEFLGFNDSGNCNININCDLGNDWQDEKRGVVMIVLNNPNGSSWCNGSLINTTAEDGRPYVLTADHCEDGGGQAFIDTWVFIFNYESANCSNPQDAPLRSQSISGAQILANSPDSDFLLLELDNLVPQAYNAYFNGWSRNTTNYRGVTCIHHPSGDIKKISTDADSILTTNLESNSVNSSGNFYRVVWDKGTTEGGSSGSPLFNNLGQIVGQLFGGFASCTNSTQPDWYGKLSSSWQNEGSEDTQLASWLDPLGLESMSLPGRENELFDTELAVDDISVNAALCDYSENTSVEIRIRNNGLSTVTDFTLAYELKNANEQVVSSGTRDFLSLSSGSSIQTEIFVDLSQTGQTYKLQAFLADFTDDNPLTDARKIAIHVPLVTFVNELPYIEDFENGAGGWTVVNQGDVESSWALGEPQASLIRQAASGSKAWVTNLSGNYNNDEDTYLLSPLFNFENRTQLALNASLFVNTEENYDGAQLQVSSDCGLSWERLGNLGTGTNWYNIASSELSFSDFGNMAWSGVSDSTWKVIEHSITAYAGQRAVLFRVLFRSDFSEVSEGIGFDNFSIRDLVTSAEDDLLQKFNVYPNPSQGRVVLSTGDFQTFSQDLQVSIYHISGRFIRTIHPDKTTSGLSFSVEDLRPGLYLLKIRNNHGEIIKKIMKQ